jgi:hypothetical protein
MHRRLFWALSLLLLIATTAQAQLSTLVEQAIERMVDQSGRVVYLTEYTVAKLPAKPSRSSLVVVVTDGSTATDCTAGSGSNRVLCAWSGSAWAALGGTAAALSLADDSGLDATGDVLKVRLPCTSAAGNDTYACNISPAPTAYTSGRTYEFITDVANTGTASFNANGLGATTIKKMVAGSATVLSDGDIQAGQTVELKYHTTGTFFELLNPTSILPGTTKTKNAWISAGALYGDGTQCPAAPSTVTINSGAPRSTFLCADNDGSILYGELVMPADWNAGTVTVTGKFIQTAVDTSALAATIATACRTALDTINATFGTTQTMNIAAMGGSNKLDTVTSAAVTANGTCHAGDLLQFKWNVGATDTTTAMTTMHVLGFQINYTSTVN